jgi:putative flippase GtrA
MVVSLAATAADFVVFGLLGLITTDFDAASTFLSMLSGAAVSWHLHRHWVFGHSEVSGAAKRKRYALGVVLVFVSNIGLMAVFADLLGLPRMACRVVVATLVWIMGYWFNRRIVFEV